MNKAEWQAVYDLLFELHTKFGEEYHTYKNGKNKKIKEQAEKEVYDKINLAEEIINKFQEVYALLFEIEKENGNKEIDMFLYDEFFKPYYFGNYLTKVLQKIKGKIEHLDT